MINMTDLAASLCGMPPRFAQTSCSQCGRDTGPGNSGHSSCATHTPPATQPDLRGMVDFEFTTENDLTLRCYLDYEPAEKQTHWEPGCSESIDLVYAFAGLIDVAELLSDKLKAKIEELALADMADKAKQAEYDRAEARYNDMREAA